MDSNHRPHDYEFTPNACGLLRLFAFSALARGSTRLCGAEVVAVSGARVALPLPPRRPVGCSRATSLVAVVPVPRAGEFCGEPLDHVVHELLRDRARFYFLQRIATDLEQAAILADEPSGVSNGVRPVISAPPDLPQIQACGTAEPAWLRDCVMPVSLDSCSSSLGGERLNRFFQARLAGFKLSLFPILLGLPRLGESFYLKAVPVPFPLSSLHSVAEAPVVHRRMRQTRGDSPWALETAGRYKPSRRGSRRRRAVVHQARRLARHGEVDCHMSTSTPPVRLGTRRRS
jgi:hypothetical protein